jgi:glucose/arabinose dehydrogenase
VIILFVLCWVGDGSLRKGDVGGLLLAMVVSTLLASVVAVLVFPANSARGAATLPPNFARSQVVGGLADPTAMEFAPDGRLFVAEQRGTLRVVKAGGTLATFLDISGRVASAGERGLLGVAFDPWFLQKPLRLSLLHAEGDYHLLGPQPGDPRRRQW